MFIRNLDGKTVVLEPTLVVPTSTVRVLKGVIEAQEGILPQDQRLIYGGKFGFEILLTPESCAFMYDLRTDPASH